MRFRYSESDGEQGLFRSPDDLFPPKALIQFLMQHGQEGLDALPEMDEQVQALLQELIDAGLIERDEESGALRLTPRMHRSMQHRALLEIFGGLKAGVRDGHVTADPGKAGERSDGTKPYEFGDAVSEIATHETLRNAIRRGGAGPGGVAIGPSDFETHHLESTADTALCVLIDLSGSMARYGRHVAAKRIAMGLAAMVRERFRHDTVDFIGFASVAERLREEDLPLIVPKPVTTRAWEVKVRIPLRDAKKTHPHMTNLQHALRMARATLMKRGAANKQVFVITDGQPTAHLTDAASGPGHEALNLIYPPTEETAEATLTEALRLTQAGIRLSLFALIEEYHDMDWVGFVDRLARLTRGMAFSCVAGDLGTLVMDSYLAGKRKRKVVG